MTKILYFITDLGIGGAEKILVSTLKKLDKEKYHPIVCCLYGGELLKEIEKLDVKVIDFKIKNKLDFSFILKFLFLLRKERPNIVHTHLFHANIIGRIIARLAGIPVVISTQHYSLSFHGRLGMFLDKLTSLLVNQIIAVSESAKRFCISEGISYKKVRTIYNGIEFYPLETQAANNSLKKELSLTNWPLIGSVGRFVEVKGYKYFLYAAVDIIKHYPDAKFILLGYGPLKSSLIKLAADLNISRQLIFIEPSLRVDSFLSIIDVYILPSLSEGLSITLLEAMAMGKPVVATRVGGNPEAITDGETGLLIPPGNPTAIGLATMRILENKNLSAMLGFNARKIIEKKFNIETMVKSTETIYDSYVKK